MNTRDTTNRRTGKPASQSPGESRIKKTAASSKSPQTTHKAPKGETPSHWEGVDLSNYSEVSKTLKADPICVLCGNGLRVRGGVYEARNPWPLAYVGKCCRVCDVHKVQPARFRDLKTYAELKIPLSEVRGLPMDLLFEIMAEVLRSVSVQKNNIVKEGGVA